MPDFLTANSSPSTPLVTSGFSYEQAFVRNRGLISPAEQARLRNARVAIIGMGGVGGIHLVTLARLGIGKFTIADPDRFELANVNRQYGAMIDTFGRPKVDVMAAEARRINPEIELRVIDEPIRPETVGEFLAGADLFVDGVDFFSIALRRRLFRHAAANGLYSVTAGPLGFGAAWLVFDPRGMSFDDYFDLSDGESEIEQLVAYAVGLAPAMLHRPYLDLSQVSLGDRTGPSAGLACQLCAGVVGAEAVRILLNRGAVCTVPCYSQFDAYRGRLRRRRLRFGNRHPIQRLKRLWLRRKFADL